MKISSANRIISIKVSNREDMTCYALYEDDDCNHSCDDNHDDDDDYNHSCDDNHDDDDDYNHSCDYDDYIPCGDDGNDFDCNQLMKT